MDADIITWFLLSDKPEWANPLDICVTAYLLSKAGDNWTCAPKVADMLRTCGVSSYEALRKSMRRLEEHNWITVKFHTAVGLPNEYTVMVENLPRFDQQTLAK